MSVREELSSGRDLLEEKGEGQSRPEGWHLQRPWGQKEPAAQKPEGRCGWSLGRDGRVEACECHGCDRTLGAPLGSGCESRGDTRICHHSSGSLHGLLLPVCLRPVLLQHEAACRRGHGPAPSSQLSTSW